MELDLPSGSVLTIVNALVSSITPCASHPAIMLGVSVVYIVNDNSVDYFLVAP